MFDKPRNPCEKCSKRNIIVCFARGEEERASHCFDSRLKIYQAVIKAQAKAYWEVVDWMKENEFHLLPMFRSMSEVFRSSLERQLKQAGIERP